MQISVQTGNRRTEIWKTGTRESQVQTDVSFQNISPLALNLAIAVSRRKSAGEIDVCSDAPTVQDTDSFRKDLRKEEIIQTLMASSRLERIGNIYLRVRGLIRSGAIKPEDKPVWYDVYEAFPPKIEPQYGRKASDITVRPIFYSEDIIRAKFYERFGSPGLISLANNEHPTPCQKFLDKYKEMEKDFPDEKELFEAVVKAMEGQKLTSETVSSNQPDTGTSMAAMFSSAVNKSQPQAKINLGDLLTEK